MSIRGAVCGRACTTTKSSEKSFTRLESITLFVKEGYLWVVGKFVRIIEGDFFGYYKNCKLGQDPMEFRQDTRFVICRRK